jgi:protein SCO1
MYRGRQNMGPFTFKAAALFVLTGIGLVIYFRREKVRVERLRTLNFGFF